MRFPLNSITRPALWSLDNSRRARSSAASAPARLASNSFRIGDADSWNGSPRSLHRFEASREAMELGLSTLERFRSLSGQLIALLV